MKESIEGERDVWRDTRAKWLILHLQHTKQSKCESAFLPLSFFMFFLSDGQNGRKEQGRKLSAQRQYLPGMTKFLVWSLITFISRLHA